MKSCLFEAIVALLLVVCCYTSDFVYDNIFDYAQNLTAVYKDPGHVFGEDLKRVAVFYLDELMELEDAFKDVEEEPEALKVLTELYHSGGPKHIKEVPYARFIDTYNWTMSDVDDYARYIRLTAEAWDKLLNITKELIKSGKMADKPT